MDTFKSYFETDEWRPGTLIDGNVSQSVRIAGKYRICEATVGCVVCEAEGASSGDICTWCGRSQRAKTP